MKYRKNSVKGRGFERGATAGIARWGSEEMAAKRATVLPRQRWYGPWFAEQMRAMLYGPQTAMQRMTKAVKV